MKLLLVIIQDADLGKLQKALITSGFQSTKLASTGGFLREGNTTLIIGVDDHEVHRVKEVVRAACHERVKAVAPSPPLVELQEGYLGQPVEVTVGGAVVFVLSIEEYVKI
ncbi:MAG: cyclic-di-AMP receptor [Deinococcota bacterium]|jgi:uncharacterized protein YaaQ|nr:cyclic-di-AMP receptor [Deinococcota bacterium]